MLTKSFYRLVLTACAISPSAAFAAPLTPGNLVVFRVGTGAAVVNSQATAVFLDEYTPAGTFVQSFPMPTTGADAFTIAGTSTTEGNLHVSKDGNYITCAGYAVTAGTAAPGGAANARTVARLSIGGVLDTTTHMDTTLGSASSIRGAVTDNGSRFWVSTADRGAVYLSAFGATQAGVQLNTTNTNLRDIDISNGQLYINTGSVPVRGVCTVGTGLPTVAGQTVTLLNGFPTANNSPYSFDFDSPTRIYVGDNATTVGLQEWTLDSSSTTWTLTNLAPVAGTPSSIFVTAGTDPGDPSVYVTLASTIQKTPKAAPLALTPIVTAATNTLFRGIAVVPDGSTVKTWNQY